ncbi:MAG: hypothetical protein IJY27_07585 [Clostridia bacterium]|nr:hypothetical protein [Clostridia bacterium]
MKKIISLVITLTMALSLLALVPMNVSAAWGGGIATAYSGGTGTEADPYLIGSANELALLANTVNSNDTCEGKYFKLTNDIDLGGVAWDPIGNYANKTEIFKGHLDGDGYTVSGLNVNSGSTYAGLFGRIVSATVKNLNVKGVLVTSVVLDKTTYVGGIVAYGIDGTQVINCTAEIELVKGTTVGGVIGRMQNTSANAEWNKVTGCFFSGNVEGVSIKNSFAGGIIGVAGAAVVSYCGNSGDVTSPGATTLGLAGGVVACQGAESVTAHIRNCFNTGNISITSTCSSTFAGGIVGRAAHVQDFIDMADVANCFSVGSVTVKDENGQDVDGAAGSLIGHIRYLATVSNCYTNIPLTEMSEVGTDATASLEANSVTVLTDAQMKGAAAVTAMKLNEAWVAGDSYPTIDVAKALTVVDEPAVEGTTTAELEQTTEPTPEETTTAEPEVTTPEPTPQVTTGEQTTPAPDDEPVSTDKPNGPNIFVILIVAVIAVAVVLIVVVVVTEKKKANK